MAAVLEGRNSELRAVSERSPQQVQIDESTTLSHPSSDNAQQPHCSRQLRQREKAPSLAFQRQGDVMLKGLALALALMVAAASPVAAKALRPSQPASSAAQTDNDYYTNASGHRVHRPVAAASEPASATAQCRDGTYSFSEHARGTCSHHRGVAHWIGR
jgi:hypothetical protein